ncbi:DUF2231 domain-containing protein [Saccharothrix saharensis]|uniref:DUF2231 domain-containing protein n=1 Tax=Saccharothrix saharensis TaxID=571190 RepID=UPI00367991C8
MRTVDEKTNAYLRLLERVERSDALDGVIGVVNPWARRLVAKEPVRRFLHGEATGIPVHIVAKDMPFGAWFMAQFLDCFPDEGTRRAATRLVGLGLVGAVPAAVTGWADWVATGRGARRVGVVHAAANGVATAAFAGSWVARVNDRHRLGVGLARFGGVVLAAGGFLGGSLSRRRRAVDRRAARVVVGEHAD